MGLTDSQQEVVDCTDREILVTAGAGSGKTKTTVERYINLVGREQDPLELRQILVFTFTDKAAGELRERVRSALRKKAAEEGTRPGQVSLSAAWVGTFHAICNRILKAWPVEAGIDPGFTVLDTTSSETLMGTAFDRALARLCGDDPDKAEMVGLFGVSDLRGAITYAYDELRSRGIERPRLPDFDPTPFPATELAELRRLVDGALQGDLTPTRRERLEDFCELLDGEGWGRLNFGKTLGLRAGNNEAIRAIEDAHKAFCDAMASHLADPVRLMLGELLEEYGRQFNAAKSARSALDYEDLQLLTLKLLRENDHIRDSYCERFREIMVDEFQDTNGLQVQLIKELRGEAATLTTVGDEMQSIYRFRHADVELFRQRRREEGVRTIELRENFRSRSAVISGVNLIGDALDRQVSAKRGPDASRHEFAELVPGRDEEGEPASVTMIVTDRKGWKELDLGEMAPQMPADVGREDEHFHEAEALALAHHLRDLVDDRDNGISQGDIAILLRAKTRSRLYVDALRQVGLVPYLSSGGGFWKTREVIELKSILSVVANPLDDNHLLGALTSPGCGLSTDALWLLKKGSKRHEPLWPALRSLSGRGSAEPEGQYWLDRIPDLDRERAVRFVDTIESLRRRSATLPLAELIEAAVTETGYDLANLLRDRSANGFAAIRRAESLAREYEASEGRSLRGFLDWAALSEELDSEASAATADESSNVVRVMTVHAAKGLQFKVTCVPDLGRQCSSRHDHALRLGRSSDVDPEDFKVGLRLPRFDGGKLEVYSWKELKEYESLATEDEELRLLHVAMTRAEDHLVLCGVLPRGWQGGGDVTNAAPMIRRSLIALDLSPGEDDWPDAFAIDGPDGHRILIIRNEAGEERAGYLRSERPPTAVPAPAGTGSPPLARPEIAVYPDVPLSFTAFAEFAECPARFYAKRVLKVEMPGEWNRSGDASAEPLSGRSRGTRFGSAVHDVLEQLANSGWRMPASETVEQALVRNGLRADDPEGDAKRASDMIEGFLGSELGRQVAVPGSAAEVPLLIRYEDVTIRGSADLIHGSNPSLVLDYKTNRLEGGSPEAKMEDYDLQRGLYALAVAKARGEQTVETAYVFLERPHEPVFRTYSARDFEQVEAKLRETLADIKAGNFFGATAGGPQPCGRDDCAGCRIMAAQIGRATPEAT